MRVFSRVGTVLFSDDAAYSLVELVERAVKAGVSLRDADLCARDLRGARLPHATLDLADLQGTRLAQCDLSYASLRFAKLSGADLRSAVLRGADLFNADLRRADLRSADLTQIASLGIDWAEALIDPRTRLPFSPAEASTRGLILKNG